METTMISECYFLKPHFKIDLIVWKQNAENPEAEMNKTLKQT